VGRRSPGRPGGSAATGTVVPHRGAQMGRRDYYDVLGVQRTCTLEDLRRVYRKLALDSHPDRTPGNQEAEERFKEVNEAYSVLSDPQRREQYDMYGHAAPSGQGFEGFGGVGFGGARGRGAGRGRVGWSAGPGPAGSARGRGRRRGPARKGAAHATAAGR